MKSAYRAVAGLICVLVVVQAAGVALGTFGILKFIQDGNSYTESIAEDGTATGSAGQLIHSLGAAAIALLAIVLLIMSFFAKIEGGVKWAGYVFLSVLAQWILAVLAYAAPVVGLLHGINAFVIFGVAMVAAQNARRSTVSPPPAPERQRV
jgi:hypothetical protein